MPCFGNTSLQTRHVMFLVIASVLLTGPRSYAEQREEGWPHLRGASYDGQSSEVGLADEWPDEGPPVLWVKELGQGYSSFVVQNERAYTQYQTLAGQYLICLDATSGKTIWSYRYDWPFEAAGLYPGPFSTPTIAGQYIYISISQHQLVAQVAWTSMANSFGDES